jgi:hypothetical protein
MGKTKEVTTKEVATKEVVKETMSYKLTMPDGSIIEGSTTLREFQPNEAKKFQNSGFQVKVSDGDYSGNIMIIDRLKQKRI